MTLQNASYWEEFYEYLNSLFLGEGLSPADAHDQIQETYLRAFKHQHNGGAWPNTADGVKAWLTVAAGWVHKDFRKKQKGRGKMKRPVIIPLSTFSKEQDSVGKNALESSVFVEKDDDTARMMWLELLEVRGGIQVVDAVKLVECGHTKKAIAKMLGVTVRQVDVHLRLARDIVSRALSA